VRPVIFHPTARDTIRQFPKDVRNRLGRSLFRLQMGDQIGMPQSRPMGSVAGGVSELRLQAKDGSYRVFYYTASRDGVLVVHAFVKKTQRTPPMEIQIARKRLQEILNA
jgi:phage-related protein